MADLTENIEDALPDDEQPKIDPRSIEALLKAQQAAKDARLQELRDKITQRETNRPMAGRLDLTPLASQLDQLYGGNNAAVAKEQVDRQGVYNKRTDELFDKLVDAKQGASLDNMAV
jgi:hypothetical protein